MFLKSSLEEKLKRSLGEYNSMSEDKRMKTQTFNRTQKFRIFNSKNDKLSFPLDHKKFNDDDVPQKVKDAKGYVLNLIDPDILELRKKRWDISSQPSQNEKPELKRTLFEVSHGLRDFKLVELKDRKVEMGTDTRNFCYEGWNASTLLEQLEKKHIASQNNEKAKANTVKFWKEFQLGDSFADIEEVDKPNTKYKNPIEAAFIHNQMLSTIKRQTSEAREKIKKQVCYDNPASTENKIEAIVFKKMYTKYRDEFSKLTGKKKPEEPVIKEAPKLSEIDVINQVEQMLKKQKNAQNGHNGHNGSFVRDEDGNGSFNQDLEMFSLLKRDRENKTKKTTKKEDSYPIDYQTYKNNLESRRGEDEYDKESFKIDDSHFQNSESVQKMSQTKRGVKKRNLYSNDSSLPPLKYKNKYYDSNDKNWKKYEHRHPGNYVEFVYKEKVGTDSNIQDYKEKKELAWSCCMNGQRESKGCKKVYINRLKWNLDSIA